MTKRSAPAIYNIAAHGGFADALAQGLIDRFAKDPLGLARGLVILPNNRARRAVHDAFVRLSEDGLLLPQMAVIGDLELDESIGVALDSGQLALDIPPSVDPLDRLLMLARLIEMESAAKGNALLSKEALRLAREFARTLDQLTVEEIALKDLFDIDVEPELSGHWQDSLAFFRVIAEKWQAKLNDMGAVDEAARRNALFDQSVKVWKTSPPNHFVVAAGITTSAPAIARFLRAIAFLPDGMVVLPDLDMVMTDEEWDMLGPFEPDSETGKTDRAQETHPQYHMKLLLERMSIARGEIVRWPRTGTSGAAAKRSRALSNAFAIPKLTSRWQSLDANERSLAGVQTIEARNSAEEAQIVAILAREALETPERRVAIITPDRALAGRISAHLERWMIAADDTAGQPLSKKPEGTFFLALLSAATDGFPPAEFLTLLKHPLVRAGEGRLEWLSQVRKLDLLMRGPRPAPGLSGIDSLFQSEDQRTGGLREELQPWWQDVRAVFEPAAKILSGAADWAATLSEIRQLADLLTNGQVWAGPAGRQLADFLSDMEDRAALGPMKIQSSEIASYFETFLADIPVRPPYGGHPRIALYGLLEARLQQADLVLCCGLNEGSWPQAITPDPWLAPMVRKSLGLPAQERQIGLSAHDLVGAMGAQNVVLTRAGRDGSGPAIASRFLLRLRAMCGDNLKAHPIAKNWARRLDQPEKPAKIDQPAPEPSAEQRLVKLSVTQVDRLIADPYAFYASRIMGLGALDMIDAEPSPAWRGSIIHDILDKWAKEDDYDPDALKRRAEAFLNERSSHPLMRTLWAPRLMQGLLWVADTVAQQRADGRIPVRSEQKGSACIAGVDLFGIADRIDRMPDGNLGIVDYKTGGPPSNKAVKEGFALQLGLLGAIAEKGDFGGLSGDASSFEYWSLAKSGTKDSFGYIATPTNPRSPDKIAADEMVDHAVTEFTKAVTSYIKGDAPMTAKLHPEYAPYADYDQLMRLEEWYGRAAVTEAEDGHE
ncbi:double-strand break repair protein AddB [Parasphingorhabdus cellanae]|uniref:Double-strand break repair protein AddB n=1 Tax=Parasphingorhabdus cellanae TaxID=2806553 RepID=A0ABX7T7C2_9SPHN|nr:double-strand break repair protein AddB [Parasphingorhabdus cellanae]QTD56115.1 double-strand break repair protein AddB [Parasphingorhabdus cellanae]